MSRAPESPARGEALALLSGRARFAVDVAPARLLHAAVLRVPRPSLCVARLDVARAAALPGVACVLSGGDTRLLGDHREARGRIAAVAAEDPELAQRALEAIEVEYREPSAAEAGAPPGVARPAGIDNARADSEQTLETRLGLPPIDDVTLEPRVVTAWLDEDERLVIQASGAEPVALRAALADALGRPLAALRVEASRTSRRDGGLLVEDICGLLALRTRRPVSLRLSRSETRALAGRRTPEELCVRSGLRARQLSAVEVVREVAGMESVAASTRRLAAGYAFPGFEVETGAAIAAAAPTNDGLGELLAFEAHVDRWALSLGEDPLDLRKRWLRPEAAALLDSVAAAASWTRRRRGSRPPVQRAQGLAVAGDGPASPGAAEATLRVNGDGSCFLAVSLRGRPHAGAALCRIAAEALGVEFARVQPVQPDTDALGLGTTSFAAAAAAVAQAAGELAARRDKSTSGPAFGRAAPNDLELPPSLAAAFAEVELDSETGVLKPLRLTLAVRCGRVVHRAGVEAEVRRQALEALRIWLGLDGPMRATDVPEITLLPAPPEAGIGDPCGLGIAPQAAALAALVSAVGQATGVPVERLPLTPQRVRESLGRKA